VFTEGDGWTRAEQGIKPLSLNNPITYGTTRAYWWTQSPPSTTSPASYGYAIYLRGIDVARVEALTLTVDGARGSESGGGEWQVYLWGGYGRQEVSGRLTGRATVNVELNGEEARNAAYGNAVRLEFVAYPVSPSNMGGSFAVYSAQASVLYRAPELPGLELTVNVGSTRLLVSGVWVPLLLLAGGGLAYAASAPKPRKRGGFKPSLYFS
jgi:hypothetical protein